MATARPRLAGLGALRRQSMRVYNEPFTPKVDQRDENEAHILVLQLPDFSQQHVKVNVEKEARTVVVTGDRNVGVNRLLIVDKTYPIPQNCVIDQINHKLEDGILTITMPKQTIQPVAAPAVEAPEQTAAPPPPPSPPKESKSVTAPAVEAAKQTAAPLPPPSPPVTAPAVEAAKQTAAPLPPPSPPKESEQSTPEKGKEETSPEKAAPPETKAEIKGPEASVLPKDDSNSVKPTEEDKGKSAELQKQASGKGKEKAPMPAPAEKGLVQVDSGEEKTTPDQKISSPDQKPTEKKKEIENKNPEKVKESKTEEVDKKEKPAEIRTTTPSPRVAEVMKLSDGFKVRRMPLRLTASLTVAIVIAVAAYFTYAYYGFSFATE